MKDYRRRLQQDWVDYAVGEIGMVVQSSVEATTVFNMRQRAAIEGAISAGFRALLDLEFPTVDDFIRYRLRVSQPKSRNSD